MRWTYLVRRLAHGLAVVLGVAIVVFVATHVLGDPAKKMLPLSATQQQYERFRHNLGLDRPLPAQFRDFIADAARLDFGTSIWHQRPARDVVFDRLPNTFALMAAGMGVALLLAFPLGIIASLRPGSWLDSFTVTGSLLGLSLPQFWLGSILILVFAVHFKVLPTSGTGGATHLVLPALALGLPIAGKVTQMVRSAVVDELQRPYVLAARAKGLTTSYILVRHVLRNALVPVTSFISLELARVFAGATVVVEAVFAYEGIGYLAVEAMRRDDIILMQAIVLVVGLLVVLSNLVFDLLATRIDPRIRLQPQ